MDVDDLLDDPKLVVRLRALRAARKLLADRGLSVSMEDIAGESGVSRRSLFRYFDSRDALVADALESFVELYGEQLEDAMSVETPFEDWLHGLVSRLYHIHRLAGRGMWQLAASTDAALAEPLVAVNDRRRTTRRRLTKAIAAAAWRRGGGTGDCPEVVTDAVALTISSFAYYSMVDDYRTGLDDTVTCAVALLTSLIERERRAATVAAER